jgi:hypothetical protein
MRRPELFLVNKTVPAHLKSKLGKAGSRYAAPSVLVPLAGAAITTQSVHQETIASSRVDRKFHEQLFILRSCEI